MAQGDITYNAESTAQILELVKIDLGISVTDRDAALTSVINYARSQLEHEGLNLDETAADDLTKAAAVNLVRMYAAWLWRKRDTGEAMPRMLRASINNNLINQIAAADDTAEV